ncbi:hypothetical protein AVEN_220335-1 [Araneus ventricosus]|uniref:Uncharacterized protein n=1 Tax=Araneus ventricosus TaxID=182803 RepID=A0A4Y2U7K6_ARAVE|nr:hypothetical protein AVEN_220335-1 [Araneus ventricosus]
MQDLKSNSRTAPPTTEPNKGSETGGRTEPGGSINRVPRGEQTPKIQNNTPLRDSGEIIQPTVKVLPQGILNQDPPSELTQRTTTCSPPFSRNEDSERSGKWDGFVDDRSVALTFDGCQSFD